MFREKVSRKSTQERSSSAQLRRKVAAAALAASSLTACLGNEVRQTQDTVPVVPPAAGQAPMPATSEEGTVQEVPVAVELPTTTVFEAASVDQFVENIGNHYEASAAVLTYTPFTPEIRTEEDVLEDLWDSEPESPEYDVFADEYQHIISAGQEADAAESLLETIGVDYRFSVETRSGLKFNFYQPSEEADPLAVDPRALDVLVDFTFLLATQTDSMAASEVRGLYERSLAGGVDGIINMTVSTDPNACVLFDEGAESSTSLDLVPPDTSEFVLEDGTPIETTTSCGANGVNLRLGGRANTIQSIVIGGFGVPNPQPRYSNFEELFSEGFGLEVNAGQAIAVVHELAHAFMGLTGTDIYRDSDTEHKDFVFKVEEKAYNLFCRIGQAQGVEPVSDLSGIKEAVPFTDPD